MKIKFDSLKDLLAIIKKEKDYKIQIITREDIKIFQLFLDNNKLNYHINYWNNSLISNNRNIIHVYTNPEDYNPNYKKIILFSPKIINDFIQIPFVLTYEEKSIFLKNKYKKNYEVVLNAYKNYAIHELCRKIDQQEMVCMAKNFDYIESLILFSMCKCSKLFEIIKFVKNVDKKISNKFLIKMKINGLINKKILTFKNNLYKINISLESLELICKEIDLDIQKM